MSVNKAEDLEVKYEEVDPKCVQQIHMYQASFTSERNCKPVTRKKTGCTYRCSIIIAVVLMALMLLISIVMLPLMAYEIREIGSTLNKANSEKQNKSITNHQDQLISDLGSQLISLMEQNSTSQNLLTDLVSQVALLRGELNSKKCLVLASKGLVADIQELIEFDSCNFLKNFSVQLPSGLYKIMPQDALTPTKVYCSYQSLSGRNEWWRRVAYLSTSESYQVQCPSGLGIRTEWPSSCRRALEESGCSSVYFDPGDIPYSRVGGRVRARQSGQPDGFQDFNGPRFRGEVSLEDNYVDGISLTYGDEGNRTHIWTFAASVNTRRGGCAVCNRERPDFIGDHYSCELLELCNQGTVCNSNLLWDGGQCVGGESFFRDLPGPTTEQIEMRVCREQDRRDEDILVTEVELYVL